MENIKDILSEIWSKINNDLFSVLRGILLSCVEGINEGSYKIFDYSFIQVMLSFFRIFGFCMYITGSLIAFCNIIIEYTTLHSINFKKHIFPFFLGLFSVYGFTSIPCELYKFSCNIQKSFLYDIFSDMGNSNLAGNIFFMPLDKTVDKIINMLSSISIIYIIIIIYCVIKVFLSTIKRGGVLLTMIGIGSINMFSIPNNGYEVLFRWCKQILALCITAFFQTTLLSLGFALFAYENILGIGLMIASSETGRIAQVFGLDVSAKESFNSFKTTAKSIIQTGKLLSIL